MKLTDARLKWMEARFNLVSAQREGDEKMVDTYTRLCFHYHTKIEEWKRGEKHIYVE